jgi:hypothetical protein
MPIMGIERIDRLPTIAASRRNASLREIDRRRAVLGRQREFMRYVASGGQRRP